MVLAWYFTKIKYRYLETSFLNENLNLRFCYYNLKCIEFSNEFANAISSEYVKSSNTNDLKFLMMEKAKKYLIYFISINLFILGLDKFLKLMPLSCTLLTDASESLMYGLGVIEILLAVLLFLGKFTKTILVVVVLFMVWAIVMHLMADTYDIGGAVFLAVLSTVLLVLPKSINND